MVAAGFQVRRLLELPSDLDAAALALIVEPEAQDDLIGEHGAQGRADEVGKQIAAREAGAVGRVDDLDDQPRNRPDIPILFVPWNRTV